MSACPARLSCTPSLFCGEGMLLRFFRSRAVTFAGPLATSDQGDPMRKVFHGLLAAGAAALLFALPVWAAADPGQFVKNVTGQLADIARTKSGASRDAAVREVLRNNFDLAHVARVALGSHWTEASEPLRARFLAALEAAEARAYGERLTKLAASDVTIDKVDARPNGVSMVKAVLTQANGQTVRIEWEVHDNGRGARIADLKVSGVSMSQIKRSEYNLYIQSNGGQVEPLVKELEARAAR
ncbi:MAG TPA: ABC transporter substrate-binding protein [Dongiaceae bacterium]|nr:ABC transporter substrate-binding protein [Dongiaceae bacterium]